jgi:hypothetical protein
MRDLERQIENGITQAAVRPLFSAFPLFVTALQWGIAA